MMQKKQRQRKWIKLDFFLIGIPLLVLFSSIPKSDSEVWYLTSVTRYEKGNYGDLAKSEDNQVLALYDSIVLGDLHIMQIGDSLLLNNSKQEITINGIKNHFKPILIGKSMYYLVCSDMVWEVKLKHRKRNLVIVFENKNGKIKYEFDKQELD
jgi:hypothetical protein